MKIPYTKDILFKDMTPAEVLAPFTRLSEKLAKNHEWDVNGNYVCKK